MARDRQFTPTTVTRAIRYGARSAWKTTTTDLTWETLILYAASVLPVAGLCEHVTRDGRPERFTVLKGNAAFEVVGHDLDRARVREEKDLCSSEEVDYQRSVLRLPNINPMTCEIFTSERVHSFSCKVYAQSLYVGNSCEPDGVRIRKLGSIDQGSFFLLLYHWEIAPGLEHSRSKVP